MTESTAKSSDASSILEILDRLERRMEEREETQEVILIDKIEKRMKEREVSKNKVFGIGVAVVSLLSAGMVKIMIDSAATNAVDSKISSSMNDIEGSKKYLSLSLISDKMTRQDSFSDSDKNTAMSLLRDLAKERKVQSEADFPTYLEQIIDALFATNNTPLIDEICELYQSVCYSSNGIVQSLIIARGGELLSAVDPRDPGLEQIYKDFSKAYDRSRDGPRGGANAYKAIWVFKLNKKSTTESDVFVEALTHMRDKEKAGFLKAIAVLRDPNSLSKNPGADDIEMARSTQEFLARYAKKLDGAGLMPPAASDEKTGENKPTAI
jgi:hypothetical protein